VLATTRHGRDVKWLAEQKHPDFPILTPFHHPSFALPALHLVVSQCHWGVVEIFNGVQPGDQLLVEVTAFGQWPSADAVEDLTPKSKTGVEAAGGVFLRRTSGVTAEHKRWL
jgi:hypothetical protein